MSDPMLPEPVKRFFCYHFFWLSAESPYFAHIAIEKNFLMQFQSLATLAAEKMAEQELGLNGLLLEDPEGPSYWDKGTGVYRVEWRSGDPIETLGWIGESP